MTSCDLNLRATELCLGLPGAGTKLPSPEAAETPTKASGKRGFSETNSNRRGACCRAQVVGWPPVRSYRRNVMATTTQKSSSGEAFVKVCMDGAPYLRKVDLKMYSSYQQLSDALAKMFSSFTNERKVMDVVNSSEYVPSYEDKDGDWMLVGDVPWEYVPFLAS
ncbi:unnamed protein product [Linum tenue]|uniref:Auxin-responsive protein n=1 Tax=Linum tenue TaxID=586396 RepID=A0AAV0RSQ8_9ROSI|nr:unnamed protein product [Linum tenue]